jgi:hypothetical protein
MAEFPDMVYKVPGSHRGPAGHTFDFLGVDDAAAMKAALAAGWHATIDAAIASLTAQAVVAEVAEAKEAVADIDTETREELEARAKKLGVSFNARTRNEVLAARIAEAA